LAEFEVVDAAGLELLTLACEATDRAQKLNALIDADGAVLHGKAGPKAHPALRDELNNRAFAAKCLEKLGVTQQPVRAVGRPPKVY
jgi:hypothetical protein